MNKLPSFNPLKIPNQIRLQSSGLSNPCHFKNNCSSTRQSKGGQRTRGAHSYRRTVWVLIWWWPPCLGDHRTPPPPPPLPWSPASSPRGSSSGGSTSRLATATCAPVWLEKTGKFHPTPMIQVDTEVVIHDNTSVVNLWIRIENNADPAFISMRIRIRSQGAKPMPRIRLCRHKNVNLYIKYRTLHAGDGS